VSRAQTGWAVQGRNLAGWIDRPGLLPQGRIAFHCHQERGQGLHNVSFPSSYREELRNQEKCSGHNVPQKNEPGFVVPCNLNPRPMRATVSTASALGRYPDNIMSKSRRLQSLSPSYKSHICSAEVFVPLTCLYPV
jgi:hypothetical protein